MRSDRRTASSRQDSMTSRYSPAASRPRQGHFSFAADVIHRRAQIVRNVRRESRNALERLFQSVQHLVEGAGQRCQFERISVRKNALPQVLRTDVARGRCHFLHGTNAVPRNLVPNQGENGEGRQQNRPEPKPIACQQLLFLRDINRNLNGVSLSCGGPDRRRRAGHTEGLAGPAFHTDGAIGTALGLTG